jgi:hypothetical protein
MDDIETLTYFCNGCSQQIIKPFGIYQKFYNVNEYDKVKKGISKDAIVPEKLDHVFCNNCAVLVERAIHKTCYQIFKKVNEKKHVLSN